MAVKPDKSRIMFTTDSSFESFLKDMCLKENRNMSNLVDTILKNHYKDKYEEYLSSIDKTIYEIVREDKGDDYANTFIKNINNSTIPFDYKLYIMDELAHSTRDISIIIESILEDIGKNSSGIIRLNNKTRHL